MPSFKLDTISLKTFDATLSRYSSLVPERLKELDTLRYDTIPAAFAEKIAAQSGDDQASLAKDEVEKLVEWKLKHGTFRPALLSLVQSNSADFIQQTTHAAFKARLSSPKAAAKILTELRGIGPATASLLLSVASPDSIPFFSDELFRWCMWDEGTSAGWKRVIKYSMKEYEALLGKVEELKGRLGVRAVDVERVAWVLGREGVNVDAEVEEGGKDSDAGTTDEVRETKEAETEEEGVTADIEKKPRKGTKRKATGAETEVGGTRKRTRTRR